MGYRILEKKQSPKKAAKPSSVAKPTKKEIRFDRRKDSKQESPQSPISEAQLIWTLFIAIAVVVAALYQVGSPSRAPLAQTFESVNTLRLPASPQK